MMDGWNTYLFVYLFVGTFIFNITKIYEFKCEDF